MSKVAVRVIRDSKHVGTVPRKTVAEVVRTMGRDAKSGIFIEKRERDGVRGNTKR